MSTFPSFRRPLFSRLLAPGLLLFLWVAGCATRGPISDSGNDVVSRRLENGLPQWIFMPRSGLKDTMIGGVGTSHLADVDIESAKSEASLMARNNLAKELESNIRSVISTEAAILSKKRSSTSKLQKLMEERMSNVIAKRIVGSRVDEYVYLNEEGKADFVNPKTVTVRVILDVDIKGLATDLGANEMTKEEQDAFSAALRNAFSEGHKRPSEELDLDR